MGGTWAALSGTTAKTKIVDLTFNSFQFVSYRMMTRDIRCTADCSVTYNGLIGCLVASILGFRFHYEFRPLDQLTIRMQLQSSCRDILMRVSECYTFELAIITR